MVREAERRAGRALLAMIDDKGLSLREAVDWCGNGVTHSGDDLATPPGAGGSRRERSMNAGHGSVGQLGRVVRT